MVMVGVNIGYAMLVRLQFFPRKTDESFAMHTAVLLFWYCNPDGKIKAGF